MEGIIADALNKLNSKLIGDNTQFIIKRLEKPNGIKFTPVTSMVYEIYEYLGGRPKLVHKVEYTGLSKDINIDSNKLQSELLYEVFMFIINKYQNIKHETI